MANPASSPFVVTELTGDQRTITLTGRAMPYRPLTLSGKQRAEFSKYPGNPQQSLQVLGAEEEPTTVHGMWKDRFISPGIPQNQSTSQATGLLGSAVNFVSNTILNPSLLPADPATPAAAVLSSPATGTQNIVTAMLLGELFDDVRRKGQLLQVTWNGYKRVGIITQFKRDILYETDMRWEMSFGWISQGEPDVGVGFPPQQDQSQLASGIGGTLNSVKNAIGSVQGVLSTAQDQVQGVISKINAVSAIITAIGDTAQQAIDLAMSPFQAASNIAAALGNVVSQAQDIEDALQATPLASILGFGAASTSNPFGIQAGVGQDALAQGRAAMDASAGVENPPTSSQSARASPVRFSQVLQAAQFKRQVRKSARTMRYQAARARAQILVQQQAPDLLASFRASAGQDFRHISAKYYGTIDQWRQLAAFNGIHNTSLAPPGTLINVPRTLPNSGTLPANPADVVAQAVKLGGG